MIHPWIMPRSTAIAPLGWVAQTADEMGDREFALYSAAQYAYHRALCGLTVARAEAETFELSQRKVGSRSATHHVFELLRNTTATIQEIQAEVARSEANLSESPHLASHVRTFWVLGLCVMGQYADAVEQSLRMGEIAFEGMSASSHLADFCFFQAIAVAARMPHVSRPQRRAYARILATNHRRLRRWAVSGPDFVHMAEFLTAERHVLRRRVPAALAAYQSCARRAEQAGYMHHAALAHERCADLLQVLRREIDAAGSLSQAIRQYEAWGASFKVSRLQARRRELTGC